MAWVGTERMEHVSERMELLMPCGAEVGLNHTGEVVQKLRFEAHTNNI